MEDAQPVTLANPAPLGLAGFGLTTVVLSAINAELIPTTATPAVVPLAFAYGGVAQLIAGVLEFRKANTFGMVAFTSYGLFWWWYARSTLGIWGVFLLLWITLFLLAAGDLGFGTGRLGGWIGLATGLAALYVSFAEVTNETFGRTVLPLGKPIIGDRRPAPTRERTERRGN